VELRKLRQTFSVMMAIGLHSPFPGGPYIPYYAASYHPGGIAH